MQTYYLVLYDAFGNCQRVAQTTSFLERQQFLDAGFVEVSEDEYNRCAQIAERVNVRDLALLAGALGVLNALLSRASAQRQPTAPPTQQQLDNLVNRFARDARELTRRRYAGEITTRQWYDAMASQIRQNRLGARALGVGGVDNLSAKDLEEVARVTRRELSYLAQFRDAIDNELITERQAMARSAMYFGGAREQAERGFQDAIGLPPMPAEPGVRTICRRNCKCSWQYVKLDGNGNWDCFWKRSPVDSCETCIARERAFNPLKIRNGIIQPFPTANIYA